MSLEIAINPKSSEIEGDMMSELSTDGWVEFPMHSVFDVAHPREGQRRRTMEFELAHHLLTAAQSPRIFDHQRVFRC